MNKAFKQEMNSFVDILKKIQITKKPKVFCFYRQKKTSLIVIDNIAIERFFRTLKYDEIYINEYASVSDLRKGIERYINFYNFERFHSSLDYDKPMNVYLKGVKKVG